MKKKMKEEIKQLQKDILELDKEMMAKNQKILDMEFSAIKKQQQSTIKEQKKVT